MVLVDPYLTVHTKEISRESIIFDPEIHRGKYCVRPYPRHPSGCPNFNKNPMCPPHSPYLKDSLLHWSRFFLFYAVFDFKTYKIAMRDQWVQSNRSRQIMTDPTDEQVANCIYYQNQIKAKLYGKIGAEFRHGDLILGCGSGFVKKCHALESVGINVYAIYDKYEIPYDPSMQNLLVFSSVLCIGNDSPPPVFRKQSTLF